MVPDTFSERATFCSLTIDFREVKCILKIAERITTKEINPLLLTVIEIRFNT